MGIPGKKRCTAIVLSAGQGKRMGGSVQKQYMQLCGKPVIYYPLATFQRSELIDSIILVVGEEDIGYARRKIVEKYQFGKVDAVITGGKERYDSVWLGLQTLAALAARETQEAHEARGTGAPENGGDGYVFIHDGARPLVDEEILLRGYEAVKQYGACAAGMPSKDTVKLADGGGFARETPPRECVWTVQTPQIFQVSLITEAYSRLMREGSIQVTDDAMVAEKMTDTPVKLFPGSYENIKITTPGDMKVAEALLRMSGE